MEKQGCLSRRRSWGQENKRKDLVIGGDCGQRQRGWGARYSNNLGIAALLEAAVAILKCLHIIMCLRGISGTSGNSPVFAQGQRSYCQAGASWAGLAKFGGKYPLTEGRLQLPPPPPGSGKKEIFLEGK